MTDDEKQFLERLTPDQFKQMGWAESLHETWHEVTMEDDPYELTFRFHMAFDLPRAHTLVMNPSVSDRELRLRLIFEEFEELCEAMGFELSMVNGKFMMHHIEGSRYDPVETGDALADLNVVVNGTGVVLGMPMRQLNREVFMSNMTKLGPDGKVILNRCVQMGLHTGEPDHESWCDDPNHFIKPDAPRGKALKGPDYIPPNIVKTLYDRALKKENDHGE